MDSETKDVVVDIILALQVVARRLRGSDKEDLERLISDLYKKVRKP